MFFILSTCEVLFVGFAASTMILLETPCGFLSIRLGKEPEVKDWW